MIIILILWCSSPRLRHVLDTDLASDRTRSRGGTTEGGVVERLDTHFSPRSAVQRDP